MSDQERKEWLKNYVRTYLERDVRDLANIKNLDPFIKIKKISASLTGQIISYSTLAKEAGVSNATAQRFFNYMDLSYQIIKIQPWCRNKLKRLIKSPKLHFLDPGILQTVTGRYGELSGTEFESAIIAEIYKQLKYLNVNISVYFLRTFDGREVDLLLETTSGYYAFEVKSTTNVTKVDLKNFKGLESILDKPLLHCFILSNDVNTKRFEKNIIAVHAALFLG